ncbi:MAG: D-tyrosyl-tRNA(Tyr) deacylase [Candidatus Cloacimonetes bacterium]|jgi:D-aminoacyl-tRNA deacylase|nr:D-tyrosyl-tRNA(Tyr) deacylase [Candidatus Cloacimonadota bacterium]MBT6994960.1 D-tyrosyl-tRNA(Tyr) deacylase [Candidatus Cloacimonadota bacterium]
MRLLIQRVTNAEVKVDGKTVSAIKNGFLIFIGIHKDDDGSQIKWLAQKVCNLRIFNDKSQKMNLPLKDVDGEILLVSQFTLYGKLERGNRPEFMESSKPKKAEILYLSFADELAKNGFKPKMGKFGENMKISLLNDGPVTLILEK